MPSELNWVLAALGFFILTLILQIPLVGIFIWFTLQRDKQHAADIAAMETRHLNAVQKITEEHEKQYAFVLAQNQGAMARLFEVVNVTAQSLGGLTKTVEAVVTLADIESQIHALKNPKA